MGDEPCPLSNKISPKRLPVEPSFGRNPMLRMSAFGQNLGWLTAHKPEAQAKEGLWAALRLRFRLVCRFCPLALSTVAVALGLALPLVPVFADDAKGPDPRTIREIDANVFPKEKGKE